MERIVECPSGFAGRVSHLAAGKAGVLGDARMIRSGKAGDVILKSCWLETTELGPYRFERTAVDWSRVLTCDRVFSLLMIRIATYGETEELDMRCVQCGHKFVWDLPLLELPVRPLPEATREAISAGRNRFETSLSDGTAVFFKIMDGKDQLRAAQLIQDQGDDLVVAAMKARVVEVEGVGKSGDPRLEDFLSSLSMGAVQDLIDEMDDVDGGVDTAFDVFCPSCQAEWEVDLPLDLQRMFVPQKPTARRRRRRAEKRKGRRTSAPTSDGQTPPVTGQESEE